VTLCESRCKGSQIFVKRQIRPTSGKDKNPDKIMISYKKTVIGIVAERIRLSKFAPAFAQPARIGRRYDRRHVVARKKMTIDGTSQT